MPAYQWLFYTSKSPIGAPGAAALVSHEPMKPQVEAATKIHSLNRRNLLVLEAMNEVEVWHDVYNTCTMVGQMKDHTGNVVSYQLRRNPFLYGLETACHYRVDQVHLPGCTREHDNSNEQCPFYNRSPAVAAISVSVAVPTPSVLAASLTPVAGPFMNANAPFEQANKQGLYMVHHHLETWQWML